MTTELLYYKPRAMREYAGPALPGTEMLSLFFKLYAAGSIPVDRTGTIRTPVNVKSLFPIPTLQRMTKSFEELCNERARELLQRAETRNVPLYILWSGGIDSTLALTSLIKNASESQKNNIVVVFSGASVNENPRFFEEHIRAKLKTETASEIGSIVGGKGILTNGEHNDQIFGSDMMRALIMRYGSEVLHEKYTRDRFYKHFVDTIENDVAANRFLDLFEKLNATAPISLHSNFDFAWWINFCLKWQTVNTRMLTFVSENSAQNITAEYFRDFYAPFFNTEDFQLWALNNQDKKIKDEWRTYKWVCKDIIYDFTGDAEYRDNKLKTGSLSTFVRLHPSFTFLDSQFRLTSEMKPDEWFVSDNDFVI